MYPFMHIAQKWTESFDTEKKGLSLGQFELMADFMKYQNSMIVENSDKLDNLIQ